MDTNGTTFQMCQGDDVAKQVRVAARGGMRRSRGSASSQCIHRIFLDSHGEEGLTFRSLSERLATGPGAIYWHIANKGELLTAACDAIVVRTIAACVVGATPKSTVRALASGMFDAMDAHPFFQGATTPVLVTWAPKGGSDTVDFGQPVSVVDPRTSSMTRTARLALTDAPVLIDHAPAKIVAQAQENLHKPFPWGGDYTNAKSVSVTMGEKNVEKGLHTQGGDAVAADVLAYGGNARSGNVPGGNVFMVDPNFLSYTQTPIEITATVRRDPANDPAQVELDYESTNGEKKAPAFVIPDNVNWHKATWRLTDAEFVSMYGFNFRFNKGNYVVQSVTVTKLD